MTTIRYMKLTHTFAMAVLGALLVLTIASAHHDRVQEGRVDGTLHFEHQHEPDKWVNLVCNAKDQGASPAQTANWLVHQYGFGPAAASQHTMNHWASCR